MSFKEITRVNKNVLIIAVLAIVFSAGGVPNASILNPTSLPISIQTDVTDSVTNSLTLNLEKISLNVKDDLVSASFYYDIRDEAGQYGQYDVYGLLDQFLIENN
jgi:hypothetical protein